MAASLDFEVLARAVAAALQGDPLHVAIRVEAHAAGAERVAAAGFNWAALESREVGQQTADHIAAEPLEVLHGVLLELAILHHGAHIECQAEAKSVRPGRPKQDGKPKAPQKPAGRPPELNMTNDKLHDWAKARLASGQAPWTLKDLQLMAKETRKQLGAPAVTDKANDKMAASWSKRLKKIESQGLNN